MDRNLDDCVQLGNGQTGHGVSTRMMATTMEAVIGAVYLDGGNNGLAVARAVMGNLGILT